ncbi:MAG: hypothetical protein CL662_01005 [Bacteroidetes bacterium]|nr:hypothetical protein [Bacteroidota bacterium]
MKKSELRQIIKEEISKVLSEEQMEMSFKTFEDIKEEMSGFSGFKELSNGGFSLPALGLMGDVLGYYEFKDNNDQTVNVRKFDKETSLQGEKNHPVSVFADFMEMYGS